MTSRKLFITLLLFIGLSSAQAAEWQSMDDIVSAVERFVKQKTVGIGNEVDITVSRPDARLRLGRCDSLETWLPSGNKLWGRASVGVRCRTSSNWSIYVPVMVKVSGNAIIATHPIARGVAISADDVQLQNRDLTQFSNGVFTSIDQVIGKTTTLNIQAGDVLRQEQLRAALTIRQGQQVTLIAQGAGFKVSSEGTAMANAATGQVVAVKTRSGQIIKGIAKSDGIVEVYF